MNIEKMAEAAVLAVKKHIEAREAPLIQRIEELEKQVESIPVPRHGKDGEDGKDGKSFTAEDAAPIIEKLVAEIIVPKAKDGKDGEDGKDGTSVSMEDVEAEIKKLVDQIKLPELPPMPELPELPDIAAMVKEAVDNAVKDIQLPQARDGQDGRDAIDIEVLAEIDMEKSYQRGVYARHAGGLFRSFEKTKGLRGWECIVDGIAAVEIDFDGERALKIKSVLSSGGETEKEFTIPAVIYRGVHSDKAEYKKSDAVTHAGSIWIAKKDNPQGKPLEDGESDWKLSVKRGRDGAEVVKIPHVDKTVKVGGAA